MTCQGCIVQSFSWAGMMMGVWILTSCTLPTTDAVTVFRRPRVWGRLGLGSRSLNLNQYSLHKGNQYEHHHDHDQDGKYNDISSFLSLQSLVHTRGGAISRNDSVDTDDDEEYDESDVDDDNEEDEEDFLDDFDDNEHDDLDEPDLTEADFNEDSTLERVLDAFSKTPPLTKAYLTGSFAATFYGYMFHQNQFPPFLSLQWKPTLQKLQLWRPFTAFFNFGPFGVGYLMTAQFIWQYMATLERLCHKAPYDFWIMIVFGQLSMVLGYPLLNLSPRFLGHNLSTFLVYIWARYHEGIEVNLFELFNTRAELLPWFFLAQTFLLEGEPPVLDFLGIVFGHIYHYCKTVGILRAPPALVSWYKGNSKLALAIREQYKTISSEFEMI